MAKTYIAKMTPQTNSGMFHDAKIHINNDTYIVGQEVYVGDSKVFCIKTFSIETDRFFNVECDESTKQEIKSLR